MSEPPRQSETKGADPAPARPSETAQPRPSANVKPEVVLWQGWLLKQGGSTGKFMTRQNWKRRWVVLSTREFSYYKTEEHFLKKIHKLGFVPVEECYFEFKSEQASEDTLFSFNSLDRKMFLRAETPAVKAQWLALNGKARKPGAPRQSRTLTLPSDAPNKAVTDNLLTRLLEAQDLKTWEECKVYKQGYLLKQSGRIGKPWKKRWIVLDSEGVCIFLSREVAENTGEELGFMAVGADFDFQEESTRKESTIFILSTNARTLVLKAETAEEKAEWIKILVAFKAAWAASAEGQVALAGTPVVAVPQPASEKLVNPESFQEGYLTKLGDKHKSWKRRYFVLVKNELQYHKHPKEKRIGSIRLTRESVFQASRDMAFSFFLVPEPNGRAYLLSAKDTQDQVNWLAAFSHAVPEMKVIAKKMEESSNQNTRFAPGNAILGTTKRTPRSIKEGFLLMQGHKTNTWKRRYFVLLPKLLEYYKNPHDRHPKDTITFTYTDTAEPATATKILITMGPKKLLLDCTTNAELMSWLTALQSLGLLAVKFTNVLT